MADDDVPPRPRRERPLRAPGRDDAGDVPATPPPPPAAPTVTTPPVGPPVIEFGSATDEPERDDHVIVSFDGPTSQRRWTVALRIILAIPHFLWLFLLGIALLVVGIVAWFAALFTGRVPDGMANFLASVVQYQTRVYGYGALLLSDKYPPFALDSDYAINVATNPGQLNRAAVFFRIILMVPGYIVSTVAVGGAQVVAVVGWLLALILGRLPTPLWEANAAVLRYYTRFNAFTLMLTAEQPGGLFGDKTAAAPVAFSDEPDLPATPQISRLVLSQAARRLVVLFIVLGALTGIGSNVVVAINALKTSEAYTKLDASHDRLGVAVHTFSEDVQRCAISGGLQCLHDADTALAEAFDNFGDEVQAISFPASIDASPLVGDARDCADALRRMSEAPDQTTYSAAFSDYSDAAQQFDQEYSDIAYDARFDN